MRCVVYKHTYSIYIMAPSLQLQDDQKFSLMKFRRNVHEILQPQHDDQFLLRWLRARNWDAEAAEKMLRTSMQWRKTWEVDTNLKSWKVPQILLDYLPSGQAGYTDDGSPVIIVPFCGFDVWGLLHTVTKQDIIKNVILILEHNLELANQNGTHTVSVIFDMEGFNIKPYMWRPAAELVISLIQMYEANYPEILNMCYIINAPSIFSLAFNIVKKFIGEYTINKIKIFKNDPEKWKPILTNYFNVKTLPKHYGGEAVDPDGNPKCASIIKQGGKIPKHLYSKNQEDDKTEYVNDVVKSGKQLTIDFMVPEEGCYLKWDFRTEDHDIKFGIVSRNSEGVESFVVPIHKVNSHIVSECGAIQCDFPTNYSVIFDNSHSMIRSKKIFYDVQLETRNLDTTIEPAALADETEDTAL